MPMHTALTILDIMWIGMVCGERTFIQGSEIHNTEHIHGQDSLDLRTERQLKLPQQMTALMGGLRVGCQYSGFSPDILIRAPVQGTRIQEHIGPMVN